MTKLHHILTLYIKYFFTILFEAVLCPHLRAAQLLNEVVNVYASIGQRVAVHLLLEGEQLGGVGDAQLGAALELLRVEEALLEGLVEHAHGVLDEDYLVVFRLGWGWVLHGLLKLGVVLQ